MVTIVASTEGGGGEAAQTENGPPVEGLTETQADGSHVETGESASKTMRRGITWYCMVVCRGAWVEETRYNGNAAPL